MDDRLTEVLLSIALCIISILLGYLFGAVKERAAKSSRESEAMRGGIKCLLRGRIVALCDKALEQGYVYIHTFEMLDDLEAHYKALGGNGTAEKLLADVKRLEVKGDVIHG